MRPGVFKLDLNVKWGHELWRSFELLKRSSLFKIVSLQRNVPTLIFKDPRFTCLHFLFLDCLGSESIKRGSLSLRGRHYHWGNSLIECLTWEVEADRLVVFNQDRLIWILIPLLSHILKQHTVWLDDLEWLKRFHSRVTSVKVLFFQQSWVISISLSFSNFSHLRCTIITFK